MPLIVFALVFLVVFVVGGTALYLVTYTPPVRAERLNARDRRIRAETLILLRRSIDDPMWRQTAEYEKTARELADEIKDSI